MPISGTHQIPKSWKILVHFFASQKNMQREIKWPNHVADQLFHAADVCWHSCLKHKNLDQSNTSQTLFYFCAKGFVKLKSVAFRMLFISIESTVWLFPLRSLLPSNQLVKTACQILVMWHKNLNILFQNPIYNVVSFCRLYKLYEW